VDTQGLGKVAGALAWGVVIGRAEFRGGAKES
jgi:hypothetical protein